MKYNIFKKSLWQTSDSGKFIGLDHQRALGKNGISIADFYASGAKSNLASGGKSDPVEIETKPAQETTEKATEETTEQPTDTGVEMTETVPPTASEKELALGDVDGSGEIDILDVITLNKNLLGKETFTEAQQKAADVNSSGKPDSNDSITILKYIVGIIKSFEEA